MPVASSMAGEEVMAWAATTASDQATARDHQHAQARDEVERLLAERGEHLMRAAIALTGSRSDGEDLLQAALERLLRRWGRIEGDVEGYLRRILYNMAADGWRRRGAWLRKLPLVHASSGQGPGTDAVDAVDLRDALGRGAGAAAAPAARGAGTALLGGTQPGRDRRAARLRGRNGEVRRGPRAAAAA